MAIDALDGVLDPAVSLTLRCFLALVFVRALAGKVRDVGGFASTIREYELVPPGVANALATTLLAVEIVLIPTLLIPGTAAIASFAAVVVLALYSAAIGVNLLRGRRDIDCGCAGPAAHQPLHELLLVRNAAFVTAAVIAALPMTSRSMIWIDVVTITTATACLFALASATDGLAALAARSRRVLGVR